MAAGDRSYLLGCVAGLVAVVMVVCIAMAAETQARRPAGVLVGSELTPYREYGLSDGWKPGSVRPSVDVPTGAASEVGGDGLASMVTVRFDAADAARVRLSTAAHVRRREPGNVTTVAVPEVRPVPATGTVAFELPPGEHAVCCIGEAGLETRRIVSIGGTGLPIVLAPRLGRRREIQCVLVGQGAKRVARVLVGGPSATLNWSFPVAGSTMRLAVPQERDVHVLAIDAEDRVVGHASVTPEQMHVRVACSAPPDSVAAPHARGRAAAVFLRTASGAWTTLAIGRFTAVLPAALRMAEIVPRGSTSRSTFEVVDRASREPVGRARIEVTRPAWDSPAAPRFLVAEEWTGRTGEAVCTLPDVPVLHAAVVSVTHSSRPVRVHRQSRLRLHSEPRRRDLWATGVAGAGIEFVSIRYGHEVHTTDELGNFPHDAVSGEPITLTKWPGKSYEQPEDVEYVAVGIMEAAWSLPSRLPASRTCEIQNAGRHLLPRGLCVGKRGLDQSALREALVRLEQRKLSTRGLTRGDYVIYAEFSEDSFALLPFRMSGQAASQVVRVGAPSGGLEVRAPVTAGGAVQIFGPSDEGWTRLTSFEPANPVSYVALPPGEYLILADDGDGRACLVRHVVGLAGFVGVDVRFEPGCRVVLQGDVGGLIPHGLRFALQHELFGSLPLVLHHSVKGEPRTLPRMRAVRVQMRYRSETSDMSTVDFDGATGQFGLSIRR